MYREQRGVSRGLFIPSKKRFWNTYTAHVLLGAGGCSTDQVQGPSSSDHMTWGHEQYARLQSGSSKYKWIKSKVGLSESHDKDR